MIALTLGLLVGARASAQSVTPPTWLDGPAMPPHAPSGAVVTLRLEIGEDGDVRAAELVTVDAEPEAHERLASFALAAIRLARFEPARREGRAIAARVELALRFPPPPDAHDAPGVLEARASDSGTTSTYDVDDANGSASTNAASARSNAASANAASADAASASTNAASTNAASTNAASANAASASTNRRARNATTDADAVRPDDDIAEGPFGAEAVVDAERRAREAASASDQVVEVGQLRHVPRREAQSFLTLTPGVLLTQHANEGHAMSMFLRGFDAAEGEDLELRVDGVPLNEVTATPI